MQDHSRSHQNNVVQLSPENSVGGDVTIKLTHLPDSMNLLRDKARQQLQVLLRDFFDKVDDTMFELADKANNTKDQNIYFDAMREVRLGRKPIEGAFFRKIDIHFAQLMDHTVYRNEVAGSDDEFSMDSLSLVQDDDLEEIVAIDAMVNKANEQFAEYIQHLTMRIDHVVPVKVYQRNNPVGADVICHSFDEASKKLPIDVKAKLVLLKLFDKMVMANLGAFFKLLNQLLIDANVMPSLKSQSGAKKTTTTSESDYYGAGISAELPLSSISSSGEEQSAIHNSGTMQNRNLANTSSYDEQTNHVLHTLRDLLSSRSATPVQRSIGHEITSNELISILSLAQHQNMAINSFASSNFSTINIRELLQGLLSSTPDQQAQQINQVDDDVINLVSMMFDFILDDRNLASPMKALIGRLQIPMVKVAIADKSFFSKGGHPARRLLNELAMSALGWQESGEESQHKDSLYNKIESVVQTVLSDFESDLTIFKDLLSDFRAFLEKDKRRAKILEQRTVDAEAGMARSERARAQVDTMLGRITAGHDLPPSAQKLLHDAWGNVLFITALKQGVESAEWQSVVRTAQQLVWSLTAPMNKENRQGLLTLVPDLLKNLRQGLENISYSSFEAAQLFKQLEIFHLARLKAVPKNADEVVNNIQPLVVNELLESGKPAITKNTSNELNESFGVTDANRLGENISEIVPFTNFEDSSEGIAEIIDEKKLTAESVDALSFDDEPQATLIPLVDNSIQTVETSTDLINAEIVEGFVIDTSLESLETIEVITDEQSLAAEMAEFELPTDDQHYALVGNITQGSWFEMQSEDGQKFRCRLAAIIRASGKYIFVNRSGMKVAEETRMTLALALKSGRLQLLDDGMLFDRALEAVIGNLRANR